MTSFRKLGLSLLMLFGPAACGDDDPPTGGPGTSPGAPTINQPAADSAIQSPVTVAGTSEAGTAIAVSVLDGTTELGSGTGTATTGTYSVDVTYNGATVGADLTIRVIASNSAGGSPATTVAVFETVTAPTMTAPLASDAIATPVQVTGLAAADATIAVEVLDGTTVIGTGSDTADGSGAYDASVTYTEPAAATALTVRAKQTANGHESDWTDVGVLQVVPIPVISAPSASDVILTPVQVTGTAEANAAVDIEVLDGVTVIGSANATADGTGAFDQSVVYTEPVAGTPAHRAGQANRERTGVGLGRGQRDPGSAHLHAQRNHQPGIRQHRRHCRLRAAVRFGNRGDCVL